MSHPLEKRIRNVRRLARLLMVLYGCTWVLGSLLAAGLLIGAADFLFRNEDHGVRLIFSLAVLAVGAATTVRFLLPSVTRRMGDVEIAQRIERRYPGLRDRLSSAIEFLKQPEQEVTAGSAALRRGVVAQTTAEIQRLNLWDVVDYRRGVWVMVWTWLLLLTVQVAWVADRSAASLAARRLAMPWSSESWPLVNDLAFVDPPTRLHAGDDFRVELIDRNGDLPADVRILYWFEGEEEESITPRSMTYDHLKKRMVHGLTSVSRTFRYRAVGGDYDVRLWRRLAVVEPPRVASLKVMLHPPEYTGWSSEVSTPDIRALEGTRIELNGVSTRRLKQARLRFTTGEDRSPISAALSDKGYRFEFPGNPQRPWIVEKSGSYALQLFDAEDDGAPGEAGRWELQAVADRAPTISLESPDTNSFVTSAAIVPIRVEVEDDLELRHIELRYSRSDRSAEGETAIRLFPLLEDGSPEPLAPLRAKGAQGESRVIEYGWDLAGLDDIKSDTTISLYVAASDFRPQVGQSSTRRLIIITIDQLQDRVTQRQAFILGELAEILRMQRQARSQTTALEIQLQQTGILEKPDIDQLQSAELNQRRVERRIADPRDGVRALIESLLTDLDNNRVDDPDVRQRMEALLVGIDQIARNHLPIIQQRLITALKIAQSELQQRQDASQAADDLRQAAALAARDHIGDSFMSAGQQQEAVIALLEQMLGELSEWDNYRRFAREISQLRREQAELAKQTARLRLDTVGKDLQSLSSQQRADLKKLSQRQLELARRFEKTQGRMNEMRGEIASTDPVAAQTLADALDVARRRAVGGQMRQSGRNLANNQIGAAEQLQSQTLDSLQEMMDVLANRRESQLNRLLKKLREAAGELEQLQKQQKGLRKKLDDAGDNPDTAERRRRLQQLTRQQRELEEQLTRMSRRLQRLQAERAAKSVGSAAARVGRGASAAQEGNSSGASEQAKQAEKDLEQAHKQLAEAIKQVERDLAQQRLVRLEQALEAIARRQEAILAETERLAGIRAAGGLQREHRASLRDLARQQQVLADETADYAEKLAAAEVFQLALSAAAGDMQGAARQLELPDTLDEAQRLERSALARMKQVLDSLRAEQGAGPEQDSGGGSGGGKAPGGQSVRSLAELKLLKLMQEDVNHRTKLLEEARRRKGALNQQQRQQVAHLAVEQGRLAELIFNLSEPADADPEDDPENLPDIRPANDELDEALDKDLEKALEESLLPPAEENS